MLKRVGSAGFAAAMLMAGAFVVYLQTGPRRSDNAEAAVVADRSERRLAAREPDGGETALRFALEREREERRKALERELQATQGRLGLLQASYEERQTDLKRLAAELAGLRGQTPDDRLGETPGPFAQPPFAQPKTDRSVGLVVEARPGTDDAARAAFEQGRAAYREARWREARAHFETADRLVPAHAEYAFWSARAAQMLADYPTAARRYEAILSRLRDQAGEDAPETAAAANHLALLYWEQGRFAEAETLYKKAVAVAERGGPADDPTLAGYCNDLAVLHHDQGRLALAEPLLKKAVAIGEAALPADDLALARWRNNLARLQHDQGRLADAETLYAKAVAAGEAAPPADAPELARWISNLARLKRTQGRPAEAEALYKKAVAAGEKTLPADHPDLARSANNLAALYQDQGRLAEAEALYRKALGIFERKLGLTHADTRKATANLAGLLRSRNGLDRADALKPTRAGAAPPERLADRGAARSELTTR